MRISDCSSDVCSSGLAELGVDLAGVRALVEALETGQRVLPRRIVRRQDEGLLVAVVLHVAAHGLVQVVVLPGDIEVMRVTQLAGELRREIGRASCRARVCQYV